MKAKKYNPTTLEFEIIDVPEQSCVNCIEIDKKVQCANCGKEVLYIDTFTSSNIRTFGGFGFAICKQCAKQEKELADKTTIHVTKD